jgi:hypothetical protein
VMEKVKRYNDYTKQVCEVSASLAKELVHIGKAQQSKCNKHDAQREYIWPETAGIVAKGGQNNTSGNLSR